MSKNYLIGIGGTGARVIEAVVNICAAGYGPDELSIFLIDPDAGNGNLNRTIAMIRGYKYCYDELNKEDSLRTRTFFKTKINIPENDKEICWSIFKEDSNSTLSNDIHYNTLDAHLKDFANLLFSEDELKEPLNKGFRGHPSIGAVVMADPPEGEEPFKSFFDAIKQNDETKVFLVGSVFGGTGAAGVPTFGSENLIKKIGKLEGDKSNVNNDKPKKNKVFLGVALVLPYFRFKADSNPQEKMFVSNEDFSYATEAALSYYAEKELQFDHIYFIGDSLRQNVGEFSVGSITQKNKPHYIEIVVALAAFDFFDHKLSKDKNEKKYFIAARKNENLTWSDFAVSKDKDLITNIQNNFKLLILTFTTFAYSFCTYGKTARGQIESMANKENYIKQEWYKKNNFHKVDEKNSIGTDIRFSENQAVLNNFENFLLEYLQWISDIDIDEKINLINSKNIFDNVSELIDPENKTNIANLLKSHTINKETFATFINKGLNNVGPALNVKAALKYIIVFYNASMNFCEKNYNINKLREVK